MTWKTWTMARTTGAIGAALVGCGTAVASDGTDHGCECDKAEEVAEPASAVGTVLDDRVLSDAWISGAPADDEPVTLVVFWEVWCPHCVREMPRLREVDARPGIEVVGLTRLTRGATEAQVAQFVADREIGYAVGRDTRGLAEQLGVRGVPSAVALRDGEVIWQGHPATLTEDQLRSWR